MTKWQNSDAGPIQVKRFNEAWGKLSWENRTFVQLSGIVGGEEHRMVMTELCGREQRPDVAAAEERIGTLYAWTVTRANASQIIESIAAELKELEKTRPVRDERQTQNVIDENRKAKEEQEKARTRKLELFRQTYGNGQKVTAQPGEMIVTAQICFDNSDVMTDYFDRHATLSQEFALAVVKKQAQTERLARQALAGVVTGGVLAGESFTWNTENYSMGHGNYLEGKGFELPEELKNLRRDVTRGHWEVTFRRAYSSPVEMDAMKGYGSSVPVTDPAPIAVDGITITENNEKDGLEIRFSVKPSVNVLESLKAHGWRWSRFSSCWYARRTDAARQFAESLQTA